MKTNTPKNFAIQLGSLITLYLSVTALLMLLFGIINLSFPDALDTYANESTRETMRIAIAMIIVFYPTYVILTRISNQSRRSEEGGEYTVLAKWLVYISLLIGGAALLGDLVTIIIYFLNGEITTRFILKAVAFFVVVGAAFSYYVLDAKGYFKKNEKQSIQAGMAVTAVVLVSLVYGFMNIETPTQVREMRLDDQQLTDLQNIQWQIEEYYRLEETLPESLATLYGELPIPQAPEDRAAYIYEVTDDTHYELCATFAQPSSEDSELIRAVPIGVEKVNYTWTHTAGEHCFKRVVSTIETE